MDILQTLERQSELYGQLLKTAKEKTPVLIRNDMEQLNSILQKERKLIAEAESLERDRMLHTNRHFAQVGIWSRTNTLRDLIVTVSNPEQKKLLLQKQKELSELLQSLQKDNELNQQLVQQSLAFINYSIDLMIDDPAEDVVYRHPQKAFPGNSRNRMFDTKA
ncbi:flagellar protein FlgN [Paenibacillus tarimensis]